ncbi:uncharacterized protein LOC143469046 isoform X3 [Clavelina lepadiformis]
MEQISQALEKLQKIGMAVFEDRYLAEDESSRARRGGTKWNAAAAKKRALVMKSMIVLNNLPDDIESFQANYDEEDEGEQKLMSKISENWQEVAVEVRDILISAHELKMIKRPMKLMVRRALFLFKFLMGLLGLRSNQLKSNETEMVNLKTETSELSSKVGYLHNESKNWREKFSDAQEKITTLINESKNQDIKLESLQRSLNSKDEIITELHKEVAVLNEKLESGNISIEELETLEREKLEACRAMQRASVCEDALYEMKTKMKEIEDSKEEINIALGIKDEELEYKDKQLAFVLSELKAKEELVQKMKNLPNDDDADLRGSVGGRRYRTKSRKSRKETVSVTKRSTICASSPNLKLDVTDPEFAHKDEMMRRPISISSTRLFSRHSNSKTRLLLPIFQEFPGVKDTTADPIPDLPPGGHGAENVLSEDPPATPSVSMTPPEASPSNARRMGHGPSSKILSKEFTQMVNELKESERARAELETEVDELERELEIQDARFEKVSQDAKRQHRIQMLMEEEKLKSGTSKLYTEYLNVENIINKYKWDLAVLFEKSLMDDASKLAKSAYYYNAPTNPSDFVASAQTTNERLQEAFDSLLRAVSLGMQSMQKSQAEIRRAAEEKVGKETSNHIKVLTEKLKIISDMQEKINSYQERFEKLQSDHEECLKQNARLKEQKKELVESKNKLLVQLREYEDEIMKHYNAGMRRKTYVPQDDNPMTKEALEVVLNYAKDQNNKLQHRLAETEELLEKEKTSRGRMEKAFFMQQGNVHLPRGNIALEGSSPLSSSRKRQDQPAASQKEDGLFPSQAKTRTGKYAQTLSKLDEMSKYAKNVGMEDNLLDMSKETYKKWQHCIAVRFAHLVKKYYMFRSLKQVQKHLSDQMFKLKNQPIAVEGEDTNIANKEDKAEMKETLSKRKTRIRNKLRKMQASYWQIEHKAKKLHENHEVEKHIRENMKSHRRQITQVAHKVAGVVIALKKTDAYRQDARSESRIRIQAEVFLPTESVTSSEKLFQKPKEHNDAISETEFVPVLKNRSLSNLPADTSSKIFSDMEPVTVRSKSVLLNAKLSSSSKLSSASKGLATKRSSAKTIFNRAIPPANTPDMLEEPKAYGNVSNEQEGALDYPSVSDIKDIPLDDASLESEESDDVNDTPSRIEVTISNKKQLLVQSSANFKAFSRTNMTQSHTILPSSKRGRSIIEQYRRHSVAQKPDDDDNGTEMKWNRRTSISSFRRGSKVAFEEQSTPGHDMSHTTEVEVRQDLRQVRKALQETMRRNSTVVGSIADVPVNFSQNATTKTSRRDLQKRRQSLAYLGIDEASKTLPGFTTDELMEMFRAQQAASPHALPEYVRPFSAVQDASNKPHAAAASLSNRSPPQRRKTITIPSVKRSSETELKRTRSEMTFYRNKTSEKPRQGLTKPRSYHEVFRSSSTSKSRGKMLQRIRTCFEK